MGEWDKRYARPSRSWNAACAKARAQGREDRRRRHEMEDLEEMRQFMEKQKDGGQRLIVDWTREVGDVARTSHI
jgi:hypothetical protein